MAWSVAFLVVVALGGDQIFEAKSSAGSIAYLASAFSAKPNVVPQSLKLVKCTVRVGKENSAEFAFPSSLEDLFPNRLLVELWMSDKKGGICYLASIGKKEPIGFMPTVGLLYSSRGKVNDLTPAGSWRLNRNFLSFSFSRTLNGKPLVAFVRWLPEDLYKREPAQIWTSHVSALLFPPLKAIEDPFLVLSRK